jgi:hypothetical protein
MYQRSFYIIFTKLDQWRWWNVFTGKQKAHVILITPCDSKSSMMISPSEGGIEVNYYKESAGNLACDASCKGSAIVHRYVHEYEMIVPRVKFFRTCVGIAKDFLGVNKWWIITPGQLYKELTRG